MEDDTSYIPDTSSFSLNPCITSSSSVRRFSCTEHIPEVFLRSHFSLCPQFYLSIFSALPGLALGWDSRAWSEKARWLGWHLIRLEWCWLPRKSMQKMHLGWFLAQAFVDGVCCLRAQFHSSTALACYYTGSASRKSEAPALSAGCAHEVPYHHKPI